MASTLEKLLSIQGAEDQLSMDTLSEPQKGPSEREEARAGIPPPQPPTGTTEANRGPNRGTPGTEPPPDMREAWREVFRIYSHYAPLLREAARTDGPENDMACRLFTEATPRAVRISEAGEDGEILAIGLLDMLDDVWHRARERLTE